MTLQPPFVLIDDAQTPGSAFVFTNPKTVLSCTHADEVEATLAAIDQALTEGHHVAGYMAYELGLALEDKLRPLLDEGLEAPLIWMGVFDAPTRFEDHTFETWQNEAFKVSKLHHQLSRDDYIDQVEQIREHIRAGDVYQINHTFKQRFDFSGSPHALYAHLRRTQRAEFSAMIATREEHILSLSPELFVESDKGIMSTRPMKGTAPRRANPEHDEAEKIWLRQDDKSQAENLMIVDMLRNDLGRIALVGSVNVSELFCVETYPTVHQMTSTIEAKMRPGTHFSHIVHALFPCGSITGAPKVKAMELIHGLESEPRGVYTGAIGYSGPGSEHRYNVAIRTLTLRGDRGELGIGSGIVYDSDPAAEWDECHIKARFLTQDYVAYELLETLLWDSTQGFALLERHMERLTRSAASLGYLCKPEQVLDSLNAHVSPLPEGRHRVRLLVDIDGHIRVESTPLPALPEAEQMHYALADTPNHTDSLFIYHKTTNRGFYDDERQRLIDKTGCDEVIFQNERGELTEGSFTNLFVEINGQLFTPPIESGVLAGTLRAELIDSGQVIEKTLYYDDLKAPNQAFLGNSVRGLVPATPINLKLQV